MINIVLCVETAVQRLAHLVLAGVKVTLHGGHLQPADTVRLGGDGQLVGHIRLGSTPQQASCCRPQSLQSQVLGSCIA